MDFHWADDGFTKEPLVNPYRFHFGNEIFVNEMVGSFYSGITKRLANKDDIPYEAMEKRRAAVHAMAYRVNRRTT